MNPRNSDHINLIGLLAKEGWQKAQIGDYHSYRQALSRFTVGAALLTDPVVAVIQRELRRATPGLRIDEEEVRAVLTNEVIKREVLEGDKAVAASRQLARAGQRPLRKAKAAAELGEINAATPTPISPSGTPTDAAPAVKA